MALDFDEIVRIVLSAQKARDPNVTKATVEAAANSAVVQVLREGQFPSEEFDPPAINTVIGTFKYNRHTSVVRVLDLVNITDSGEKTPLHFKNQEAMLKLKYGTQTNAKPKWWSLWKGQLWLHPTPDAVYPINYPSERRVAGIDAIDDDFRDVVLNGTLAAFIPTYIPIFEKGKDEVQRFWEGQDAEKDEWKSDAVVEAHNVYQNRINTI